MSASSDMAPTDLDRKALIVPPTTAVTFVPAFSEAARMLGLAQGKGDAAATEHWAGIVVQFEAEAKAALRLAVPEDVVWTDAQCAEFMSVAMRHCEVRGEFTWNDIRMGQRRANMIASAPTLADEGEPSAPDS